MTVRSLIRIWHLAEFSLLYLVSLLTVAGFVSGVFLALGGMLAIRFVVITSVCLYVAFTQKDYRMTLRALVVYCWTEFYSFTLLYAWYQLKAHPGNSDRHKVAGQHVILLHGFMCNNGFWHFFEKQLAANGISFSYVEFEHPFGSIDDYAAQIADEVARVRALNKEVELVLVSFSMGGLAARAYLADSGEEAIRHYSVNTPYQGTQLARLYHLMTHSENAAQMSPGSQWLKDLNARDDGSKTVTFYLHSTHDTIVIPPSLSLIDRPGLAINARGHMSATLNTTAHELLCNQIKAGDL
ncbi:esterase/lipase family protein [Reinekea marinisedimentorum]|nr:alpha/beta hydrolase [Reinekea marinisedimentorum]